VSTWKKILIPTLITLTIGGIYLYSVWKHRQNPGVIGQQDASQNVTMDDVAVVRMEFPQHFSDLLELQGKSVWMKNGYTMPYFPYAAGKGGVWEAGGRNSFGAETRCPKNHQSRGARERG
jgi:hypothetical protein